MVLAYHVIFCAYGFWLPNDPRGSWSDFVGAWELLKFGRATTVDVRRSIAAKMHDHEACRKAKASLKYPPVVFTGEQARSVGIGFGRYARGAGLEVRARAVMPEHVHMVIARHDLMIESMVNQLKGAATRKLVEDQLHPLARFAQSGQRPPKAWARNEWTVYLNSAADIVRAIRYVENNPLREHLPAQRWPFVVGGVAGERSPHPPRLRVAAKRAEAPAAGSGRG